MQSPPTRSPTGSASRPLRAGAAAPSFTRSLEQLRISSFGPDLAVAQVEFVRSDGTLTTTLEVVVSPEDDAEVRRGDAPLARGSLKLWVSE